MGLFVVVELKNKIKKRNLGLEKGDDREKIVNREAKKTKSGNRESRRPIFNA